MWKDAKDQTKIQVVLYWKITNLNYSRDFFFPQKIQKISKSIKIKKIKKVYMKQKCGKMPKIKQRFKLLSI